MAHRTRRCAALTLVLILASCGDDTAERAAANPDASSTSSSSQIATDPVFDLDGRQLSSVSADGFELVAGSVVSLTFGDGALWGSGGCNQFGNGRYTIEGDTLRAQLSGMTEMACDSASMQQDERFVDFLQHLLTITVTGDQLTLGSADASITFVDRQAGEVDGKLDNP